MIGEEKQVNALIKFTGKPKQPEAKEELSKWRKFLSLINPFTKKASDLLNEATGLTKEFYQAEINRKNSEAEKFAAEAAEKAATADLKRSERMKIVNDEISKIFTADLPEKAKMLQLANLIANNPEISEQISKIEQLIRVMEVVNFSEVSVKISDSNKDDITEITKEADTSNSLMRGLLSTPIHDLDLSVRLYNILKQANIQTLGDLVSLELSDMLKKFKNFGKKSLAELEQLVAEKGLTFGMDVSKYK